MQQRHNKDIIMYYYDRHFVVVDVWMPDDNTIHPHSSVICDTTLSMVHHIDVREKVMKAMHVTTLTWLHIRQPMLIDDAKPQCELLVVQIVVNISYNHHAYFNNSSNRLSRKNKRREEYIQCGIHRTTHTMHVIHANKYSWRLVSC